VTPIRLRTEIFDQRMADRGHPTIVASADALGVSRWAVGDLRDGKGTTLDLAMHIARFLDAAVEDLFEPVPADEAA
jgi:DNA-binding XRE family transcriptional regulator